MSSKVQSRGTLCERERERERESEGGLCVGGHVCAAMAMRMRMFMDEIFHTFNNWAIRYLLEMNWIINGVCDYG
jgi:hypothetical protein